MADQYDKDNSIESTFVTAWTNGVEYFFPNSPVVDEIPDEYIRVSSFPGLRQNVSLGTNVKRRNFCDLIGEIRTPLGIGSKRAIELAQTFGQIFENETIDGMRFRAASMTPVTSETHFGYNVVIPYQWDKND